MRARESLSQRAGVALRAGAPLKRRGAGADVGGVASLSWLTAVAVALAGAVLVGALAHPFVGSGTSCEGIGFGCTPERDFDTLLIVAVYLVGAAATLSIAFRRQRRGRRWRAALGAGLALTLLATGLAAWSQLPHHRVSPGSLDSSLERWQRVLADGRSAAPSGTPLGDALRAFERRGPLACRDAYGRSTGARSYRWVSGRVRDFGRSTAPALDRWGARLRRRGERARLSGGASDRRLQVGGYGLSAGGVLYVRGSAYISELELTATTGCHRD